MNDCNGSSRWLTLRLGGGRYGLNIDNVKELVPLRDTIIVQPPQMPLWIPGVAQVREMTIAVVDLRTMLGMQSMTDANNSVIKMLDERKRDHIRWLDELELSAAEGREFKLAVDPHKCAFGRWYDGLVGDQKRFDEFTHSDLALVSVIEQFDMPHKRIHGLATRVAKLVQQERHGEACELIQTTRNTDLKTMIELFTRCRSTFCDIRKGLLVMAEYNSEVLGILVDSVDEVAKIESDKIAVMPKTGNIGKSYISGLIQGHGSGNDLLQLLDIREIFTTQLANC